MFRITVESMSTKSIVPPKKLNKEIISQSLKHTLSLAIIPDIVLDKLSFQKSVPNPGYNSHFV